MTHINKCKHFHIVLLSLSTLQLGWLLRKPIPLQPHLFVFLLLICHHTFAFKEISLALVPNSSVVPLRVAELSILLVHTKELVIIFLVWRFPITLAAERFPASIVKHIILFIDLLIILTILTVRASYVPLSIIVNIISPCHIHGLLPMGANHMKHVIVAPSDPSVVIQGPHRVSVCVILLILHLLRPQSVCRIRLLELTVVWFIIVTHAALIPQGCLPPHVLVPRGTVSVAHEDHILLNGANMPCCLIETNRLVVLVAVIFAHELEVLYAHATT